MASYSELMEVLRGRVEAIGAPLEVVEEAACLTRGHLGKILGLAENKRLGMYAVWPLLEVLGLQVYLVEHLDVAAAIDELGEAYRPTAAYTKRGRLRKRISPAILTSVAAEMGRRGGLAPKRFRLSLEKRRKINRANARKPRR